MTALEEPEENAASESRHPYSVQVAYSQVVWVPYAGLTNMCPHKTQAGFHIFPEGNQPGTRHTGSNPSHKLCVCVCAPACMSVYVSLAQSFSFCFSKQFHSNPG